MLQTMKDAPVVFAMIMAGSLIMVGNIAQYVRFIRTSTDVMLSGKHSSKDPIWEKLGLILLIFFLLGYLGTALLGSPDLLTGGILFGGSIFVLLVLLLMFHLVDSIKDRSLEITETLIGVIEARDPNLNGHSRYVQNLCMCFLEYLPAQIRDKISPVNFAYAALLHDVGKLGVPESILNKPAELTDEEWVIMRQHPKIAMDILKALPSFRDIRTWILYHHERVDGTGYYGLSGDQIPIEARIICLCDAYSAITMRRSYKEPKKYEEAIELLRAAAGTQLDPDLVRIFTAIPRERLEACAPKTVKIYFQQEETAHAYYTKTESR